MTRLIQEVKRERERERERACSQLDRWSSLSGKVRPGSRRARRVASAHREEPGRPKESTPRTKTSRPGPELDPDLSQNTGQSQNQKVTLLYPKKKKKKQKTNEDRHQRKRRSTLTPAGCTVCPCCKITHSIYFKEETVLSAHLETNKCTKKSTPALCQHLELLNIPSSDVTQQKTTKQKMRIVWKLRRQLIKRWLHFVPSVNLDQQLII